MFVPSDLRFTSILELNPNPKNAPPIDPRDAFMLDETSLHAQANGSSYASAAPSTPQVSWLRKTEYISKEGVNRAPISHDLCVCLQVPSSQFY